MSCLRTCPSLRGRPTGRAAIPCWTRLAPSSLILDISSAAPTANDSHVVFGVSTRGVVFEILNVFISFFFDDCFFPSLFIEHLVCRTRAYLVKMAMMDNFSLYAPARSPHDPSPTQEKCTDTTTSPTLCFWAFIYHRYGPVHAIVHWGQQV